jgi:hypothetical protein
MRPSASPRCMKIAATKETRLFSKEVTEVSAVLDGKRDR